MNLIKEQKTNIAMIVLLLMAALTFSFSVQASVPGSWDNVKGGPGITTSMRVGNF
ncbi:MAG: hypothetical protein SH819_11180 [Cytophagales bacterium]|nr:hypothetical protein [Cytophagales bacterium]